MAIGAITGMILVFNGFIGMTAVGEMKKHEAAKQARTWNTGTTVTPVVKPTKKLQFIID